MLASINSKTKSTVETVKILLEHNVNGDIQNKYGNTTLMLVTDWHKHAADIEVVINMLLKYNADINIRNIHGMTAISYALRNFNDHIFNILLPNRKVFIERYIKNKISKRNYQKIKLCDFKITRLLIRKFNNIIKYM